MPRTNFVAMYKLVKDKLEPQYEKGSSDLYTIVKELARMKGDGSNAKDESYDGDQLDRQIFQWIPKDKKPNTDPTADPVPQLPPPPPGLPPPPPGLPPPPPSIPPPPPSQLPGAPPPMSIPRDPNTSPKQRRANLESGSVPVDPRAEPSDFDMSLGLLPIEKWLTKIQINDRDLVAEMESVHRFGQVGRLGTRMENLLDSSREAPIFEFRDLGSSTGSNLAKDLGNLEDAVVQLHKKYKTGPKKRSSRIQGRDPAEPQTFTGAPSNGNERTCQRKKCPLGQIKQAGKCEKCPDNSVPNKIGGRCESKCPEGQARFGLFGQCESCPQDQRPNVAGNRCEGMCPINHARTGKNGECEACGVGKKPNAVGDKCEDDKCPDGQAKTGKDGTCSPKGEENKDCPAEQEKGPDGRCTPKQPQDSDCPEGRRKGPDGKCEDKPAQPSDEEKKKTEQVKKEAEERKKAEEEEKEREKNKPRNTRKRRKRKSSRPKKTKNEKSVV
ncbi:MAG: hypothetical protein L6R38_003080 [Xanthoria sp. 2 TBL-2021]|nr:MAG: hypothetical protein L6R38_003080 [Xanthoria sp. 2 TBL-2021]